MCTRIKIISNVIFRTFGIWILLAGLGLAQKFDVKTISPQTQLEIAADSGDLVNVGPLLDAGADSKSFQLIFSQISLEEIQKHRPWLLHFVSRLGRIDLIRSLLDLGLDPNYRYSREIYGPWNSKRMVIDTPMHHAVRSGKIEAVKLLVESGAEVNFKGTVPLYWAIAYAEEEIVRYLIDKGAKVYLDSPDGINALHWIMSPHFELGTDFALGLYFSDPIPLAELFLENGASIDGQRNDLKTPLQLAVENSKFLKLNILVKWLLKNKANPNIKNIKGETVLHYAVERASIELVELLMQYGADPHIKNKQGHSSFEIARHQSETENWSRNADYKKTFQILKRFGSDL